jgi:hypothetical protein
MAGTTRYVTYGVRNHRCVRVFAPYTSRNGLLTKGEPLRP